MSKGCPAEQDLLAIFPASLSDAFFEAIYGDVDEGAYDIVLCCQKVEKDKAFFAFELRKREGKCLKCSLTYGLPAVFRKHPLLNIPDVAAKLATLLGWKKAHWELLPVEEISDDLHLIPLELTRQD